MPATRHRPREKLEGSFPKKILRVTGKKILTFQDLLRKGPVCHPVMLEQDALNSDRHKYCVGSVSGAPATLSPTEIKEKFMSHYSGYSDLEITPTVIITLKFSRQTARLYII